jgi:thiamine biosynthesis lipoprotein
VAADGAPLGAGGSAPGLEPGAGRGATSIEGRLASGVPTGDRPDAEALAGAWAGPAGGGGVSPPAVHRFERRVMGSPLRLTLVCRPDDPPGLAERCWQAVSHEFDAADRALSRHRPEAGLVALNATAGSGRAVRVPERLYRAVALADRAWRVTGGAFDPRVAADLDRLGQPGVVPVRSPAAAPPGDRPHRSWLVRRPRARRLVLAEPIDLGGIGKGLALRWAWRRLLTVFARTRGSAGVGDPPRPPDALLEAGGDLVAAGSAPEGGAWLVGIEDPSGGDAVLAVVLAQGAVCTSSIRLGRWRDRSNRLVHHLLDPRTGEPGGEGLVAVTVAWPDPAWAEVWTKTLFLAGRSGIAAEALRRRLAAWWVTADGELAMTAAAAERTVWPREGWRVVG